MSEQNSFMPPAQSSLLAALPETKQNQAISGFDSFIQISLALLSSGDRKLG